jgi:hypothetical protein
MYAYVSAADRCMLAPSWASAAVCAAITQQPDLKTVLEQTLACLLNALLLRSAWGQCTRYGDVSGRSHWCFSSVLNWHGTFGRHADIALGPCSDC